jgi:hypothetical protein
MRIMRASIFVSVVVVMLIAIFGCAVRGSQGTTAVRSLLRRELPDRKVPP